MCHLEKFYLVILRITNPSKFLVVRVILSCVLIIPTNLIFAPLNVFFLAMLLMPRVIFVLIQSQIVYTLLVMLSLMKILFLSLTFHQFPHLPLLHIIIHVKQFTIF